MMYADARPGPRARELLTSWIARVAVNSGCEPLVLAGAIWPGWRMWTVDADRQLSADRALTAAQWFRLPVEVVVASTLSATVKALHGVSFSERPLCPWILSQGNRNRLKRAGLAFCPKCLAEDIEPFYRIDWRAAWVVGCEIHGARLVDRCDRCNAICEPHRSSAATGDLAHCVRCGFDLRRSKCEQVDRSALCLQQLMTNVLLVEQAAWGAEIVSRTEWFQRARCLLAKDLCRVDGKSAAAMGHRHIGLSFELQGPMEREARLKALAGLLMGGDPPAVRTADARGVAGGAKSSRTKRRRAMRVSNKPLPRERVQEAWARWLRRNRLW